MRLIVCLCAMFSVPAFANGLSCAEEVARGLRGSKALVSEDDVHLCDSNFSRQQIDAGIACASLFQKMVGLEARSVFEACASGRTDLDRQRAILNCYGNVRRARYPFRNIASYFLLRHAITEHAAFNFCSSESTPALTGQRFLTNFKTLVKAKALTVYDSAGYLHSRGSPAGAASKLSNDPVYRDWNRILLKTLSEVENFDPSVIQCLRRYENISGMTFTNNLYACKQVL